MTELQDLDELIDRIAPPVTDVRADVDRGARALRRRRGWQVGAAALSVAAVAAAGVALNAATEPSGAGEPSFAGRSTTSATPSRPVHPPRTHATRSRGIRHHLGTPPANLNHDLTLREYHDVLAEHLDPNGDQLRLAQNEQGSGDSYGTKLDWRDGGMLEIVVGRSWAAAGGFYLLEGAGMSPTTFQGQPARVSTAGSDLVVSVRHDDGTVVTLIASTAFGNNGTSTASLGLTQQQLLGAAADPRLRLPAYLR
ncbi:MAG TPA: hypothetical protein VFJ89_03070 [Nocardioides sp.]|nr:hypothetical protein [Nocardioides sp.]